MQVRLHNSIIASIACTALIAAPAMARKASEMTDLVGARASSGESQMEARGFVQIDNKVGEYNTRHGYWWNGSDKNCLHVETYDGRYSSITDASKGDCNQKDGSGDAAVAVGAVAGVALLAALLSHKKHNHPDNQHLADQQTEAQYERGYNDGLHGAAYHNYDRSDSYSTGYSNGVEQKNSNTSYHHGRGGYSQVAKFDDLTNARASSADSALGQRGFGNVDAFKSGNTAYTIWYRRDSRQCLQMTVADGRVYDIRDIQQHPRCR